MPVSSSVDADGWTWVAYQSGGVQSSVVLPPAGFDVSTAPVVSQELV